MLALTAVVALALAVATVLALVLTLGTHSARSADDPSPHPAVEATDSPVRLVDEREADLILHVSNQSFEDETVALEIAIDGITVVSDDFHVEGQHTWITFPLRLAPGAHEIIAEADSGATLRQTFRVSRKAPRFALVDHWGRGDSARLDWLFQKEPMAFS